MTDRFVHRLVDSAADAGVRNSQPEGIGRVVALGDMVCWNNLGRNVVFADAGLHPRAVFGTTLFPDEDEPSQYDLDVHAILDLPELGLVVVLNHLGAVRAFRRADLQGRHDGSLLSPSSLWWFTADVERTVAVAGRLVGSAPRSDGAIGLLVTDRLDTVADGAGIPTRSEATAFGEVTALAVVPSQGESLIVLGGDGHVSLVPFAGGRVGRPRWEADVGFRVATLAAQDGFVWAAGPGQGPTVDDYDWERLTGGGFAIIDAAGGATGARGPLPEDVAWGTGGVAVAPLGRRLAAAGRTGGLHVIDPGTGATDRATAAAGASLGIAHLAVVAGRVCCGFNRGGYRLHSFTGAAGAEDR